MYTLLTMAETDDEVFASEQPGPPQPADVRQQVATALLERMDVIINDSVAMFPFSGPQPLDSEYCARLGHLLIQMLAMAVRDGSLDTRSGFVIDLHRISLERAVPISQLFAFAYLSERTTIDEMALDETIGATTEAWPLVAQLIRRASFDVLGAYAERAQQEPTGSSIIDRLTTLHTRPVLEAVLAKELERAGRTGLPLAIILFDVDRLSEINRKYGYGVGDRILERIGILVRKYFREYDWVARFSEDSFAVFLPGTAADDAMGLAERVRHTVEERMGFRDHHTDTRVQVTVSAAVVTAIVETGDMVEAERLVAEAEAAVERAKRKGRNTVERYDIRPTSCSLAEAAREMGVPQTALRKLIAEGGLAAVRAGRQLRIEKSAIVAWRHANQPNSSS